MTSGDVLDILSAPLLRMSGAPDARTVNRAMGVLCGIDPDLAENYGDFGDPVGRDQDTGEYICWPECRSGDIAG